MYTFPPFRSEEWIKELVDSMYVPPSVLEGIDITPEYMANNPTANLYRNKASAAKDQIRRALFRHALFKIQNIEVTNTCRDDRILVSIQKTADSSFFRDGLDKITNPDTQKILSEELWKIDRCGSQRQYFVRYYREGDDGFSTRVFPGMFGDKIGMLKYYFST
jgi:hypothetical protein